MGKLQENLTEVLWQRLWPLYTNHRCVYVYIESTNTSLHMG